MYLFYPDVYFAMQVIGIYFSLSVTELFCDRKAKHKKLLTVICGGLETVLVLVLPFFWYSIVVHIGLLPLTVWFGFGKKKLPVREWGICYAGTILFYGMCQWVENWFHQNGVIPSLACALILYGISYCFLKKKGGGKNIYEVELRHKGVSITGRGFMDTGNRLYDPVFSDPVSLAEETWMSPILQDYEKPAYPVCFHTMSGKGMVKTIQVEELRVFINGEWKHFTNARIGIICDRQILNGRCQLLLHNEHTKTRSDDYAGRQWIHTSGFRSFSFKNQGSICKTGSRGSLYRGSRGVAATFGCRRGSRLHPSFVRGKRSGGKGVSD